MSKDLKAIANVVRDLLKQGATEVKIKGTDIKIVAKKATKPGKRYPSGPTQTVKVQVLASSQSTTSLALQVNFALLELKDAYSNDKRLPELEEKLNSLEKELKKRYPNKNVLKKILRWALDFSWEVFLKIAPIIISKFIGSA